MGALEPARLTSLAILASLAWGCGPPPDESVAQPNRATETGASGAAATDAAGPAPQAQAPSDTLALRITLDEPACVPGVCVCRGSTERSTGLWRVGVEGRELSEGVHCVVADFDSDGHTDYALLGGEGLVGVVMHGAAGPTALVEVDAAGFPDLYDPRPVEGPNGEPAAAAPGIFVPNVGEGHAVFLWDGDGFARTVFPAR